MNSNPVPNYEHMIVILKNNFSEIEAKKMI